MKKELTLIGVILLLLYADCLSIQRIVLSEPMPDGIYATLGLLLAGGIFLLSLLGFFIRRLLFKNNSPKIR